MVFFFFFSSRRRHTIWTGDWSSDVCSSDLAGSVAGARAAQLEPALAGAPGPGSAGPQARTGTEPIPIRAPQSTGAWGAAAHRRRTHRAVPVPGGGDSSAA